MKKKVYTVTFFLLLLPFVLVTDVFPFLRFGMFAESVKKNETSELYAVLEVDTLGQRTVFDPEKYELQDESFQYLMRNYYYRGQAPLFLKKLYKSIDGDSSDVSLQFYRISFKTSNPDKKDSVLINQFP